jgi:hypothetical protein
MRSSTTAPWGRSISRATPSTTKKAVFWSPGLPRRAGDGSSIDQDETIGAAQRECVHGDGGGCLVMDLPAK